MKEHELRVRWLWTLLSFFIGIAKISVFPGIGMWIASRYIPKESLSEEFVESYYDETSHAVQRYLGDKGFDTINMQIVATRVAEQGLDRYRWASRDRILKKAGWFFWPGVIFWALLYFLRKEPHLVDGSLANLPNFISDRIPLFLARYRWQVFDENREIIREGISRTAIDAKKSALSTAGAAHIEIIYDSGYEEYRAYLADKERFKWLLAK